MIWFIALMIGMAAMEGPKLYARKQWRELAAFAGAWALATIYGYIVIAGVKIPKPTRIIMSVFDGLF